MPDSHLRTRIAGLGLIAVLLLLVAGCGGSSDTAATTSASPESTTKSAGTQGKPRKGSTPTKSGSAKKHPAADGSSRTGADKNKPTRSSSPQPQKQKKPSSTTKTKPTGISQNSHQVGSSQQPAETNPQGKTHGSTRSPAPTSESAQGSNSH